MQEFRPFPDAARGLGESESRMMHLAKPRFHIHFPQFFCGHASLSNVMPAHAIDSRFVYFYTSAHVDRTCTSITTLASPARQSTLKMPDELPRSGPRPAGSFLSSQTLASSTLS